MRPAIARLQHGCIEYLHLLHNLLLLSILLANTITVMFKNPFSFDSRIRRTEYGLSVLIYYTFLFTIQMVEASFFTNGVIYILLIPALWFFFAHGTKRCHDRNGSAFYQFIPFYMLWMIFADGDPHENQYESDPKGRGSLIENFLTQESVSN